MNIGTVQCKRCKQILIIYNKNGFKKYRSPVKICGKCGTRFIDPRCQEIAIHGVPYNAYTLYPYIILALYGAYKLCKAMYLLTTYDYNVHWFNLTIYTMLDAVALLIGSLETYRILSGKKEKKFDKLIKESEQRLNNKSYAHLLHDLGYKVPSRYL